MYLTATNYFLAGHNPYLASAPQVYPPAFLYVMIPFASVPIETARFLWTTLSLISFFYALHLLLCKYSPKVQIFISLLALQLFPVKFALAQGQINLFVFLGFILIYHFMQHKKDFWAGFTLAIITIMKLNPIILLLYFLILNKYRSVLFFLLSFVLLNLLIDLSTPINLTLYFLQGTIFRATNPPLGYYNQSLPALLYRLHLPTLSTPLSFLILTLTSLKLFLKKETKKGFYLFLLTILLISPITWQHYLFWSIPIFIYLFQFEPKHPFLILLSLILINLNLKNPLPYINHQLIFSHATIGLLLLYLLVLISKKSPTISRG
jgi:alpha-1,2-mannosyltransferase